MYVLYLMILASSMYRRYEWFLACMSYEQNMNLSLTLSPILRFSTFLSLLMVLYVLHYLIFYIVYDFLCSYFLLFVTVVQTGIVVSWLCLYFWKFVLLNVTLIDEV